MKNNTSKGDGSSFEELIGALILYDVPDACVRKSAGAPGRSVVVLNPHTVFATIPGRKESDGHSERKRK